MPGKSERLEMRISTSDRELIEDAARAVGEAASEFARSAAVTRARQVLARAEITLMPAEQFDGLLRSLDEPDEAARLARAFARRDEATEA